MSADKPNKNNALATNQKVILGVGKHFAKVKTVTLGGASITPGALKGLFQAEIEASNALDQSRAQLAEQVNAAQAVRAKANTARKGLRSYILATYGDKAITVLEDFGMSPPKPKGPQTAEAKAASAAKASATKKAKRAALEAATASSSTAAQATSPAQVVQAPQPAQVVQAPQPAQTAAPAAIDTAPKQ